MNMVAIVDTAPAIMVLNRILEAAMIVSSPVNETVDPPLNPNHPNQRMNTPSAPNVRLWPGIACDFPFLSYFPIRGPTIAAPTNTAQSTYHMHSG